MRLVALARPLSCSFALMYRLVSRASAAVSAWNSAHIRVLLMRNPAVDQSARAARVTETERCRCRCHLPMPRTAERAAQRAPRPRACPPACCHLSGSPPPTASAPARRAFKAKPARSYRTAAHGVSQSLGTGSGPGPPRPSLAFPPAACCSLPTSSERKVGALTCRFVLVPAAQHQDMVLSSRCESRESRRTNR